MLDLLCAAVLAYQFIRFASCDQGGATDYNDPRPAGLNFQGTFDLRDPIDIDPNNMT